MPQKVQKSQGYLSGSWWVAWLRYPAKRRVAPGWHCWQVCTTFSRDNVVETCQKCHPGATRRFAGYLSHATHHDPDKYPWLFWTFWGMTGLLVGTFVVSGAHTLLWLPRAMQMRRELREAEEEEQRALEAGAASLDESKMVPEEAVPGPDGGPEREE